ncbi:30S ribosomal protein S6 [bacterium]|nr:30S ribosomal protein S6 [bacterium]
MDKKNKYEGLFIINADLAEEDRDRVIEDIEKCIKSAKGKVTNVDRIGKKKLAYKIKKRSEGVYINIKFEISSEGIVVFNKKLKLKEDIFRVFILKKK